MSEQNKINIGKKTLHSTMGRGGYPIEVEKLRQAAIEAGDEAAQDPEWQPDRADLFISGHTPSSGQPSEVLQEVIQAVVSTRG